MTCIVGWVDKNKDIYMGCDSAYSGDGRLFHFEDRKVFKNGDFLIGSCGSVRLKNILEFNFKPPKQKKIISDLVYMHTIFISSLISCLEKYKFLREKDGIVRLDGSNFLVGYRGVLYKVESDFQINISDENFKTAGSGGDIAIGVLYGMQNSNLKPQEKILCALRSANFYITTVAPPFHIMKISKSNKLMIFPRYDI